MKYEPPPPNAEVPSQPPSRPPKRWWVWVRNRRVICPANHHIPDAFRVQETGIVRCRHKLDLPPELQAIDRARARGDFQAADRLAAAQRALGAVVPDAAGMARLRRELQGQECGRWIFLMPIRGGKVLLVEVLPNEVDPLERCSSPAEMIDYLGIWSEEE